MKVTYQSCDGARKTNTFKTLHADRKFAQEWVGKNPEMGSNYAISGDGVGKITAQGVELRALFGDPPVPVDVKRCTCSAEQLDLVGCDCGFETWGQP
jgi:hypothetical protein